MLINVVLQSIMQFWAGIFSLPVGIGAAVDQICRSFLWTGGEGCQGKAKVAWSQVCYPRQQGGLDFKEVLSWNKALIFQYFCDLAQPGTMLHEWVQAYKVCGCNLWSVQPKSGDSLAWKRLLNIRDEVCTKTGSVGARQLPVMSRKF